MNNTSHFRAKNDDVINGSIKISVWFDVGIWFGFCFLPARVVPASAETAVQHLAVCREWFIVSTKGFKLFQHATP